MKYEYGKLKEGDIVLFQNPFFRDRRAAVRRVDGNRAVTIYKDFNVRIYLFGRVYEYGKRHDPIIDCYCPCYAEKEMIRQDNLNKESLKDIK